MTNGTERMRLLLFELYEASFKDASGHIDTKIHESDTIKPLSFSHYVWTLLFKPGSHIEYFMDDIGQWCEGTIASPLDFVSDCAMVTVFVPSLGEPRRFLISHKEAAKWRFFDPVTPAVSNRLIK